MNAEPALWQPQFKIFKDALADAENLTEGDLYEAVALLPYETREQLAAGPKSKRWACGVCETFDSLIKLLERGRAAVIDLHDPRWIVYLYHEVPKNRMKRRDQLHYGPLANECYERGIAVYRAAGWTGDASEPNA